MIVLCGSSMSFIEKEILAEKNPLYGRATGIYKMTQMGFYDAIKFFPNYSIQDKIYAYSILGGIPHYLKEFDDSKTIKENIKENYYYMFSKTGFSKELKDLEKSENLQLIELENLC